MRAGAGLLLLALAGCSPSPPATLAPPTVAPPGSTAPTAAPSPTPVGSQAALGPLDDNGVPVSLDGSPVLRGDALLAAIAASGNDTKILAGGWFRAPPAIRFCPLIRFDRALDGCLGFDLFERRVGGRPLRIAQGDVPGAGGIAGAATRPVVLRVHTHDPRCVAEDEGCDARPVLSEIAWLGEAPPGSPPPREIGTLPPGGISRDEAIQRAIAESLPHTTALVVRSASAAPIWSVAPEEEFSRGDIWVWVVVLDGLFVSPCGDDCQATFGSEEVVLDYLTGAHIMTSL